MSFEVPDSVDSRDLRYLDDMCLVTLFEQNKEVFEAVVLFRLQIFRDDPAFEEANAFFLFCGVLSIELLEAFSQRPARKGEPPKALNRAIWDHLERRGRVKYPPQAHFAEASLIYDSFAQFIVVETLARRSPASQTELDQARAIRDAVENGTITLRKVLTFKNPFNADSKDC